MHLHDKVLGKTSQGSGVRVMKILHRGTYMLWLDFSFVPSLTDVFIIEGPVN